MVHVRGSIGPGVVGLSGSFLGFGAVAAWIGLRIRGIRNEESVRDRVVAAEIAVGWR